MEKVKKHRLAIVDDGGEHVKSAYVEVPGKDYEGADFSGLSFIGQKGLKGCCFRRAILYWANLADSDFTGCDFTEADLRGAILTGANFGGSDLRGALLGKDKMDCDAEVQGANFVGAYYDRKTIFPEGFNPKIEKMFFKEDS